MHRKHTLNFLSTVLTLARFSKDTSGISRTNPSFWWVEGDSFCTDVLPLTVRSSARTFSELSSRPCCKRKWQVNVCTSVQLSLRGIKYSYSYVCCHFLPKPLSCRYPKLQFITSTLNLHHWNFIPLLTVYWGLICICKFSYVTSAQSSKFA